MPSTFLNPFQSPLILERYPVRARELLQAWDSADELILEHLSTQELSGKRILILNDSFGALSAALQNFDITSYSDSFVSSQALKQNTSGKIRSIHLLSELEGTYDWVLIRIPKNLSFFEDELCHLSAHLNTESKIVCGYMLKHQANSSFDLLNKIIGTTTTSLAKKKARLIFCGFDRGLRASPYPLAVSLDGFEKKFINHSNVFSREKLDIGTRFFLDHTTSDILDVHSILDLGCGNGALGIHAHRLNPNTHITFADESSMAIESARANFTAHFGDAANVHYQWTNSFEDGEIDSQDLVLCNPPFHQGTTVGDFIAHQMFNDAKRVLRKNGRLRVIGNTGLGYPKILANLFGKKPEIVAQNSKFTIVDVFR